MKKTDEVKKVVKKKYTEIANTGCGCQCGCGIDESSENISKNIGYSDEELKEVGGANLGLGCGNPVAFGKIKEGNTVLDLGSGAGIDCFLAAKKVGSTGKVIGVDMTEEMVKQAKANAKEKGYKNVEFILTEIEKMPIKDNSVDIIISNCVMNLTPDKNESFKEAARVLKKGGKMFVSDIVLLEELTPEQRADEDLLAGCVAGALLKDEYLDILDMAGLKVKILSENKDISKQQYQGIPLESMMIEATK